MSMTGNSATGLELVTAILRTLRVRGPYNLPTAEEVEDVRAAVNQMIDGWATERLLVYTTERVTKTLTAATASYTIGTGGGINHVRPLWIPYAGYVTDPTATTPTEDEIRVYGQDEWASISMKTMPGALSGIYYDRAWSAQRGNVYVYPIPADAGGQLVLYLPTPLAEIADLVTTLYFPPGFLRALKFNGALEVAEDFSVEPSAQVLRIAAESKAAIKRANQHEQPLAQMDPAVLGGAGSFDINRG